MGIVPGRVLLAAVPGCKPAAVAALPDSTAAPSPSSPAGVQGTLSSQQDRVRKILKSLCTLLIQQAVGFFKKTNKQIPSIVKLCIPFSHCRCNLRFAAAAVAASHTVRGAQAQPHSHILWQQHGMGLSSWNQEKVPTVTSSCAGMAGESMRCLHPCSPWCSGWSLRQFTVIPVWE